ATLEHDVVDRGVGEEAAGGQPRVPGPDDNRGDALDQTTSTVTSVGFVMASNTAERFCDWATSASMSSLEASASMSNVTVTSLKPLRTSPSTPRMPRMS